MIGSGPNGLAAAILLARSGWEITVLEAADTAGGGTRTLELTLPGFRHDLCSAVHPMAVSSPCFESFDLEACGLDWIHPPIPLAHPFDGGTAAVLPRSLSETALGLGDDGAAWGRLFGPIARRWEALRHDLLAPIARLPRHPVWMADFGRHAIRSVRSLVQSQFRSAPARALFAGIAAHSALPMEAPFSASFGLVLGGAAHAVGWPFPRGGAQSIASALRARLESHGGRVVTGTRVTDLPDAPAVLGDISPRQMLAIAENRFPPSYRESLQRYRYGPAAFKLDWALDAPIPWRAAECALAGTVHLGGTFDEIAQWERSHTGQPFVLLSQPSLFDPTRAPEGKHTAWAYCHVPNGSPADYTSTIEDQIERFAPGFRSRILARRVHGPQALEESNANLVGGDFSGGAVTPRQLFLRPTWRGYRTALRGLYICSASTPPGAGVHGMCGYHAAQAVLSDFA